MWHPPADWSSTYVLVNLALILLRLIPIEVLMPMQTFRVLKYLIKLFLSSLVRKPHSLIAASRIAAAAWNLAFATWEFSDRRQSVLAWINSFTHFLNQNRIILCFQNQQLIEYFHAVRTSNCNQLTYQEWIGMPCMAGATDLATG